VSPRRATATAAGPAELKVGRRTVAISNPGKLLWPSDGITKLDLARYYERIAPTMLPHVKDRPMNLHVFPQGVESRGFFLQDIPDHFPDWIGRVTVPKKGGEVTHPVAREAATLPYLAGQNVITPHIWSSRVDKLDCPDHFVIDFDPPDGTAFADVRTAASAAGDAIRERGLEPFAMTTGSRGIHVLVPLKRTAGYDRVRAWTRALAEDLVEADPERLTLEHRIEKRGGRIYVDVLRNAAVHTTVAPYAVRPKPGAPVATPLHWDELGDGKLRPNGWTIATLFRRLDQQGDPWAGVRRHARALPR
jgi:bifunctional non-homologous end joining protein LigD